jgi:hypothetical protein
MRELLEGEKPNLGHYNIYFKSNNYYATTLKQNPINERSQLWIEIETLLSIRTL